MQILKKLLDPFFMTENSLLVIDRVKLIAPVI
jgi:hypothetical protein